LKPFLIVKFLNQASDTLFTPVPDLQRGSHDIQEKIGSSTIFDM